jgi:hypothetical protein
MDFFQLISNSMQRKIMLHLGDPAHGIGAIKFIDLNLGKMGVMMKGVGMKGHSMGGFQHHLLGRVFQEGGSWDRFNNWLRVALRVSNLLSNFPSNWLNRSSTLENLVWTCASKWSNWALFLVISACSSWV